MYHLYNYRFIHDISIATYSHYIISNTSCYHGYNPTHLHLEQPYFMD